MAQKLSKIVISTQPIEQAKKLEQQLSVDNLIFYSMPLIKMQTVKINQKIQTIFENIQFFDKIIFTSKRGVSSFFQLSESLKINKEQLSKPDYAAIGRATAAEILKNGHQVHYINQGNTSKEFAEYLTDNIIKPNDKILLPLGNLAPDFLFNKLSEQADCTRLDIYKTIKIKNPNKEILDLIHKNSYDLLIFTSPSAFDNFIEITDYQSKNKNLKILSIGQTTSNFIEQKGFVVSITAKKASIEGLSEEIKTYFTINYPVH